MNSVPTFRFLDFCAGIGAGHAAAAKLGGECVGYSEINEKAKRTYRMLHDLAPLWEPQLDLGDLTQVDSKTLPNFDLMLGGFPCQTFSIVGQRKGFEDPRGQIIFALSNILRAKQPNYFLLENVKGLISHNGGETHRLITKELRSAGYRVSSKLLSSANYGIPQKRERVYFVGIRNDLVDSSFDFHFPEPIKKVKSLKSILTDNSSKYELGDAALASLQRYLKNKYNEGRTSIDELCSLPNYTFIDTRQSDLRIFKTVAPTLRSGRHGILYVKQGVLRKLSGKEGIALQGFDKQYQDRIKGVSDNDLLYQAGNAFTVNVIHVLLKAIFDQAMIAKEAVCA